jgi:hypothetical protein
LDLPAGAAVTPESRAVRRSAIDDVTIACRSPAPPRSWGQPHANWSGMRLFSLLPHTRLKCNFSRQSLPVELLL